MSQQSLPTQAQLTASLTGFGRDLGAGTAFPAAALDGSALRRGDAYFHTAYGALFAWNGAAWRQHGAGELTAAQRGALDTSGLYPGFRVFETNTGNNVQWTGAAWSYLDGAAVPWTALALQNSYAAVAGFAAPGYRKIGDRVELRGVSAGATTPAIVVCTLPVGSRPLAREVFDYTVDNTNYGRFDVRPDGTITRENINGTATAPYLSLSGKYFSTT